MYEGCDAPKHRKSDYCIRHTESGPRSILINTSKLVKEEENDDIIVEFVEEEELEHEEEVQPEIEEETQEEEIKVEKKRKDRKKVKLQSQIILPDEPDAGGTSLAALFIFIVSFISIIGADEEAIFSTCCIAGFLLIILSSARTSKKLDYQNACIDRIERRFDREQIDEKIPLEPSAFVRIMSFVFGFLAIVCLFDDDTFGWSFFWAILWFLCYITFRGDMKRRNDFIGEYRKQY
tara:strand:- start:1066 stop:1770 length:705 start_codon:yes stop_codon:yes gene_type:complete